MQQKPAVLRPLGSASALPVPPPVPLAGRAPPGALASDQHEPIVVHAVVPLLILLAALELARLKSLHEAVHRAL